MRVAEIMTPDPTVLTARDRLFTAMSELAIGDIRHLPIVDEEGALVGVLSQRDVIACPDYDVEIGEVMSDSVLTVKPDTPAHEAAYLIVRHKIGCVPVVDDAGKLVGIVTESDFVRVAYLLLGGEVPIDQLELEETEAERA